MSFWLTVASFPLTVVGFLAVYGWAPFQGSSVPGPSSGSGAPGAGYEEPVGSGPGAPRAAQPGAGDPRIEPRRRDPDRAGIGGDARFDVLRATANAWRDRRRYEAPDVAAALRGLTEADARLAVSEGYGDDLMTLRSAEDLMRWPRRGFTPETPVHLCAGGSNPNDRRIVDRLRTDLLGSARFVDDRHAALFIEVGDADVRRRTESNAYASASAHTSFSIRMRWIDGGSFPDATVSKESAEDGGSGDARGGPDGALARSMSDAVADAADMVRRSMAHH